jgi:hypothetical protein
MKPTCVRIGVDESEGAVSWDDHVVGLIEDGPEGKTACLFTERVFALC